VKDTRTVFICDVCKGESVGRWLPGGWFRVACGADLLGSINLHVCGAECLGVLAAQFRNGDKPKESENERGQGEA